MDNPATAVTLGKRTHEAIDSDEDSERDYHKSKKKRDQVPQKETGNSQKEEEPTSPREVHTETTSPTHTPKLIDKTGQTPELNHLAPQEGVDLGGNSPEPSSPTQTSAQNDPQSSSKFTFYSTADIQSLTWQCPIPGCCSTFSQKGDLKYHFVHTHSPDQLPMLYQTYPTMSRGQKPKMEKKFRCPIEDCSSGYLQMSDLKNHMVENHFHVISQYPELCPANIFECDHCNAKFGRASSLHKHMNSQHEEVIKSQKKYKSGSRGNYAHAMRPTTFSRTIAFPVNSPHRNVSQEHQVQAHHTAPHKIPQTSEQSTSSLSHPTMTFTPPFSELPKNVKYESPDVSFFSPTLPPYSSSSSTSTTSAPYFPPPRFYLRKDLPKMEPSPVSSEIPPPEPISGLPSLTQLLPPSTESEHSRRFQQYRNSRSSETFPFNFSSFELAGISGTPSESSGIAVVDSFPHIIWPRQNEEKPNVYTPQQFSVSSYPSLQHSPPQATLPSQNSQPASKKLSLEFLLKKQ